MQPLTLIFQGPSGSGKGTQAKLLIEYLRKRDPERPVLYLSSGELFRAFAKEDSFAARRVRELLERGALPDEFLAIWLWTEYLTRNIKTGDEHVILDGVARRRDEAPELLRALAFFSRKDPTVIVLNVSRERAAAQLKERGRFDDTDEDIRSRLDWYEKNVVPTLDYFREVSGCRVEDIDGEQSIEAIHQEILRRLHLQ